MRKLVLLDSAVSDFAAILDYITRQSGSRVLGRRFVDTLLGQCNKLASLPTDLGRPRPELRPDIRSFAFKRYAIFFRYSNGNLEVVNVLEGHRDIGVLSRRSGLTARHHWRRVTVKSTGIDRVAYRGAPKERLQSLPIHDIDLSIEQVGNVYLDPDILINSDRGVEIDLDHDVGVAVRLVVAASAGAEQCGVADAAGAQIRFVS